MKIRNIRSFIKDLRLTKPYTIAHYHFDSVSMVFVELELENGIVGYGTASPAEEVVGETSAQTLNNLQSNITQQLIGKSIDDYQSIIKHFHQLWPNYPGSVAAIDIALHDAYGKYIGKSVASILGQQINGLPTSVTIGIKSVIETIEEARAYLQLGFHVVKLKTGMSIEEDIEKVIRLKEIFHDKIHIRVDANQGYNLQQLQQFMNATKDCKLDLIEQPLPITEDASLCTLPLSTRKMLTADESLKDIKAAKNLAAHPQPFGIYNIKLMKCGGIHAARKIAAVAEQHHIYLFWGCNDESILSITAALHAAYSCTTTKYLDLDGSFDLAEDLVTGGFVLKDGILSISDAPGLGCTWLKN